MADPQLLELIRKGVATWNKWREEHLGEQADLSEAYLRGANLTGADFHGVDLRMAILNEANLSGASLTDANLNGAALREVNFTGAALTKANISWTDLSQAKLCRANLFWANFTGAVLKRANLSDAMLSGTIFADMTLIDSVGLDSCVHNGPSTLDHRTLTRSGPLPLAFLRGCGLPELLINYLPSLLNQPIQFYSCFISYSTRDQDFADRLHADLQNRGVRCWFAPHDMLPGKKIFDQIDEAIRVYDRLLLILSESSMASNWVKTEIANARQKEVSQDRQVLFPITLVPISKVKEWKCFDAERGIDSAREIREYFIPDFSGWKQHDQYQVAFDQLVKGLKAEVNTFADNDGTR
jgi:hypothetical protein